MPPGVLEPRACGLIAPTAVKDKETGRFQPCWSGRTPLSGFAELGLERGDPGFERLVLLARQPRHVLDRLELLALDHVELAQDAFGLGAEQGVELAAHALGN